MADRSPKGGSDGTLEPGLDLQVSAEEDKDPHGWLATWHHLGKAAWPHEDLWGRSQEPRCVSLWSDGLILVLPFSPL